MSTSMMLMTDLPLSGKRVLVRGDLNVPVERGKVTSDARIRAILPTIDYLRESGAAIILMSHLGRPREGKFDAKFSLSPVAERISELIGSTINLIQNWEQPFDVSAGEVVLLENVRFNLGEVANDESLSRRYASICDAFVMDAFGTAHRAQASTHGVAKYADLAAAGPLLSKELEALNAVLTNPVKPMVAIVGGSKVSTKLTVLENLVGKVDQLIVGGGIANTFLAGAGFPVGKSLYEEDLVKVAKDLSQKADIPLPVDVVVGKEFTSEASAEIKLVKDVSEDDMIFDIGPKTSSKIKQILASAGTILWNGPMGVFEWDTFSAGTRGIAEVLAKSSAHCIVGGGDSAAAVRLFGLADGMSHVSTGGGAALEYLEQGSLIGLEPLYG